MNCYNRYLVNNWTNSTNLLIIRLKIERTSYDQVGKNPRRMGSPLYKVYPPATESTEAYKSQFICDLSQTFSYTTVNLVSTNIGNRQHNILANQPVDLQIVYTKWTGYIITDVMMHL